jgi:FkbM family methyltransferase
MSFISKVNYAMLPMKYCKNWRNVLFDVYKHKPSVMVLRNDVALQVVKDPIALLKLLNRGWEIEHYEETSVILRNQNNIKLKCRLREGLDFGHILEIFEMDEYGQSLQNATVIDVGASTADSSIYFATRGARAVYGIEPMKETYDIALNNIKINNLEDKVRLTNVALASKSGKIELKVSTRDPNANSIFPTETVKKLGINFDSRRIVESVSLRDIMNNYNLTRVDLLKIDCEGCEYEVFRNIEDETISRIDNIILEFHDGVQFLGEFLKGKGYNVTYNRSTGLGLLKARRNPTLTQ